MSEVKTNKISSLASNNDITLDPDGTGDVVVASGHKLGVGTTSPTYQATVFGSSQSTVEIESGSDTGESRLYFTDPTTTGVGEVGYYHNGNSMRFSTASSERMRVDTNGHLLVAQTSFDTANVGHSLTTTGFAHHTRDGNIVMILNRKSSDGEILELRKNDSSVGVIGANESYAYISGTARGLRFGHSGSGAQIVPVTASGQGSDNNVDLGAASLRFDDVYAVSGVTTGSDENDKQQIASLTAAEMTAAKAISKLFKTFKWNSAVAAKGDAARTHTGVMAQQVETALTDAGLNAGDYAFYMSNTWWETSTEVAAVEADEEAGIEAQDAYTRIDTYHTADEAPEGATQRTRLGIRYAELMAFVGAATEQRLADIETRLAALEAGE